MPQLPTFRKGQVDDGLKKSISAHYDLLTTVSPLPPVPSNVPRQQQQYRANMRTSKSDVLLSTIHSSNSCCQFGSSQKFGSRLQISPTVRASSRANVAPGPSGVSTTTTTTTFRKNPSSFLSRVHALTMQRCPRLSNSKSFLTIGSAITKSSSRCSMAPSMRSNASTASFRPNCRLCLCDIPFREFYELDGCGCTFCRECVEQYIKIQILDGNIKILCPDGQCPKKGVVTGSEIEQLSDTDLYSKYKRFKLNTEVDLDQNRTWCPKAGCETICEVVSPTGSNKWQATPFKCPTCIQMYCSACKAEWQTEQHICAIYTKKKKPTWFLGSDDGIIFSEGEEAPIKQCPVCRVPIERDSGCAQMMCKKCKHVFCWYCLASLDDDFLLRHYDKGPCKNKLGHSRASVIWHRAQVIGIFAGFGLLILVASPLLLLAAPCILCCRCKGCDRCHDTNSADVPINL